MKRVNFLVAALVLTTGLALFFAGCLPYRPLHRYPDADLTALRDKIDNERTCGPVPAATIDWGRSRVVVHVLWLEEPLTASEKAMVENPSKLDPYDPCLRP